MLDLEALHRERYHPSDNATQQCQAAFLTVTVFGTRQKTHRQMIQLKLLPAEIPAAMALFLPAPGNAS